MPYESRTIPVQRPGANPLATLAILLALAPSGAVMAEWSYTPTPGGPTLHCKAEDLENASPSVLQPFTAMFSLSSDSAELTYYCQFASEFKGDNDPAYRCNIQNNTPGGVYRLAGSDEASFYLYENIDEDSFCRSLYYQGNIAIAPK